MVRTRTQAHTQIAHKPRPAMFPGNRCYATGVFLPRTDIPGATWAWKTVFHEWLAEQFYANRSNGADLFPEEGTRQYQLQYLLDLIHIKRPIDLSDSATHTLWLEYLTENPGRLDWWRRFLMLNGPCDTL
ncbi:hypothetical protein EON83_12660 [bacterium]|nr:MAG: hypothetical protein EON83_12660 [bacterium]